MRPTPLILWFLFLFFSSSQVKASTTLPNIELLIQQKYYATAKKEILESVKRDPSLRQHLGWMYYLALCYYRLAEIESFLETLRPLQQKIKKTKTSYPIQKLQEQFKELFGKIRWDRKEGTPPSFFVKITLLSTFSHPQKKRSWRIIQKKIQKKGMSFSSPFFYLPKGEYRMEIMAPDCYSTTLFSKRQGNQELEVSNQDAVLVVQKGVSCCLGSLTAKKTWKNGNLVCPQTVATQIPVVSLPKKQPPKVQTKAPSSWIQRHWPWVTALTVGVVATGIAVPMVLIEQKKNPVEIWIKNPKLFKK